MDLDGRIERFGSLQVLDRKRQQEGEASPPFYSEVSDKGSQPTINDLSTHVKMAKTHSRVRIGRA